MISLLAYSVEFIIHAFAVSRGVDAPPLSESPFFFFSLTPHCSSVTVAIGISFNMNEHKRPTALTIVIASQTRLRLSENASSTGAMEIRSKSWHRQARETTDLAHEALVPVRVRPG